MSVFAFGPFEMDTDRFEFRQDDRIIKLEPKAFRVLTHLILHRHRVVTKAELLDTFWPETTVSEAAIARCVNIIRKAVGDRGVAPQVIKTIHRQGYRFVSDVEERDNQVIPLQEVWNESETDENIVRVDKNKVRHLRESTGLDQSVLAYKSSLSKRTIQRLEEGRRVSFQTLRNIAETLGVSPQDLFVEDESELFRAVRIFLCHANEDKTQVREVYQRLKTEGFEPWMDEEDLLPGQLWDQEIQRALRKSDFILIFFSQNSVAKRGYVQREMKLALEVWEEIPQRYIHTIPVRLSECAIPERFRAFHWVDLSDNNGFQKLLQSLRSNILSNSQRFSLEEDDLSSLDRVYNEDEDKRQTIESVKNVEIEITINADFDSFAETDEQRFLQALGEFLKIDGDLKIKRKRHGSVKITIEVPEDKAEELLWAIKSGHFKAYRAVDAELRLSQDKIIHFAYPDVAKNSFFGCGRYLSLPVEQEPGENYTLVRPDTGNLGEVRRAVFRLVPEWQEHGYKFQIYEKHDTTDTYGDNSIDLAYLLASVLSVRTLVVDEYLEFGDVWCIGSIYFVNGTPLLQQISQVEFDAKLEAFFNQTKDHLFLVPSINILQNGYKICQAYNSTAYTIHDFLDKIAVLGTAYLKTDKFVVTVNENELPLLVNSLFTPLYEIPITRSIEFPPEYCLAGIGILNYFGNFVQQRYSEQNVTVRIEQEGLTVEWSLLLQTG